jgi:hypothetical protein
MYHSFNPWLFYAATLPTPSLISTLRTLGQITSRITSLSFHSGSPDFGSNDKLASPPSENEPYGTTRKETVVTDVSYNCSSRENLNFVADNLTTEWHRVTLKPNTYSPTTSRLSDHLLRLLAALLAKDEPRTRKSRPFGKRTTPSDGMRPETSLSSNTSPSRPPGRFQADLRRATRDKWRLQFLSLKGPTNNFVQPPTSIRETNGTDFHWSQSSEEETSCLAIPPLRQEMKIPQSGSWRGYPTLLQLDSEGRKLEVLYGAVWRLGILSSWKTSRSITLYSTLHKNQKAISIFKTI